ERLRDPADMVMSDMAPKLSGTRAVDLARALDLADAALSFAVRALRPGGIFLTKVFQGEGYREFLKQVSGHFEFVKGVKPSSSTERSAELYVLADGRLQTGKPPETRGTLTAFRERSILALDRIHLIPSGRSKVHGGRLATARRPARARGPVRT